MVKSGRGEGREPTRLYIVEPDVAIDRDPAAPASPLVEPGAYRDRTAVGRPRRAAPLHAGFVDGAGVGIDDYEWINVAVAGRVADGQLARVGRPGGGRLEGLVDEWRTSAVTRLTTNSP